MEEKFVICPRCLNEVKQQTICPICGFCLVCEEGYY